MTNKTKRYQVLWKDGSKSWCWLTPDEVRTYKMQGARVLPPKTAAPGMLPQEEKSMKPWYALKKHREANQKKK